MMADVLIISLRCVTSAAEWASDSGTAAVSNFKL
jgi:hypothetical protein